MGVDQVTLERDDLEGAWELQYSAAGMPRQTFGIAKHKDDIPNRVMTTAGTEWELRYEDSIDRIAVYTQCPESARKPRFFSGQ